jgi:S-adenosylmethionine decarboxylase
MLELYGCNERISDPEAIKLFLQQLPEIIDMHKISEPMITVYPGREGSFDKGGISGFILIAESHITIHTFNAQKYATIDIFSCKEFDVARAEKFIIEHFSPQKVERNFLMRGKEFPKDVQCAAKIVKSHRRKQAKV